jgi:hypothetical protein
MDGRRRLVSLGWGRISLTQPGCFRTLLGNHQSLRSFAARRFDAVFGKYETGTRLQALSHAERGTLARGQSKKFALQWPSTTGHANLATVPIPPFTVHETRDYRAAQAHADSSHYISR